MAGCGRRGRRESAVSRQRSLRLAPSRVLKWLTANEPRLFAGALAGTGLAMAVRARAYSVGTLDEVGPGFFPFCIGICMAICGTVLLAFARRTPEPPAGFPAGGETEQARISKTPSGAFGGKRRICGCAAIVAATLVFGYLAERAGIAIAAGSMVSAVSVADGTFGDGRSFLAIGVAPVLAYGLFAMLLGLPVSFF